MIRLSDSQAWKLAAVAIVIAVMLPILIKFWVTTVQASVNIH